MNFTRQHFLITTTFLASFLVGCQSGDEISDKNLVLAETAEAETFIGDGLTQFQVLTSQAAAEKLAEAGAAAVDGSAVSADGVATDDDPLLVFGFPKKLLGKPHMFGAVNTKVSDKKSETLGRLRLMDLTPIHVKASIKKDEDDKEFFHLDGCVTFCRANSPGVPIIKLPVLGEDEENETILIDLALLGRELNLVTMQDPTGRRTRLRSKSSKTVAFDYSKSTLVFDIEAEMIPILADASDPATPVTKIETRWYLKDVATTQSGFQSRDEERGVGFFMTERAADSKIQRFAVEADGQMKAVKYYIKNVPEDHQEAFALAFDDWNASFEMLLGKKIIDYEFLDKDDPRYKLVVAGDIRYNVLEWDIDNLAPYGGFGPSIANQLTGEIVSANVLVQGPKILEIYSDWFKSQEEADALRARGAEREAEVLLRDTRRRINKMVDRAQGGHVEMSLGTNLVFRVPSEKLNDPLLGKHFEVPPAGETFESYMVGYFRELVAHEIGHNVGLRHNFRGNLSAVDRPGVGEVSHSVMEYLGREHRHLNRIGSYDKMALAYGYKDIAPNRTDLFCTDENVASAMNLFTSPECSRDDATSDPFAFFNSQLERAVDLLTARGKKTAPVYELKDMERQLPAAVQGLTLYAATAPVSFNVWTNFAKEGRPTRLSQVQDFVLDALKSHICDEGFGAVLAEKETAVARQKTLDNIIEFRAKARELIAPLRVFTAAELSCS